MYVDMVQYICTLTTHDFSLFWYLYSLYPSFTPLTLIKLLIFFFLRSYIYSYSFLHTAMHSPLDSIIFGRILCIQQYPSSKFLFAIETENEGTIVLSIFSTILAKTTPKRFLFCEERKLYRLVAGHCVCTARVNILVLFSRFWSSSCVLR